ncbi:non-ribosomal peptide synthetase [Snuella sedimenti]|nr:non-ribosomal peptide synthetase [Snuella sedimenti]
MIPSIFIEMEAMPLMPSGKIDRKALPDPTLSAQQEEAYAAPTTTTEKQLVAIWEELLDVSPIGIYDNFFKLGGHSLLGIRLVSYIKSRLDVTVSIRDVFSSPTVTELATVISQGTRSEVPQITISNRPEYVPLSYAQERLWFIDQLQGSVAYHIPAALRIEGSLDIELFSRAMRCLVTRHESLRTVFREENGIGYQHIKDSDGFEVNYVRELPIGRALDEFLIEESTRPFDLSTDYMLRATLFNDSDSNQILILVVHHIASDGWSIPILVKELELYYQSLLKGESIQLAPLTVQYADYSIWQREYLSGETLSAKLSYWRSKLEGALPLELSTDYVRPSVQSTEGKMYSFTLDKQLTESVYGISQAHGATLFMTLLSIYKVLLYRYTGQTDISVGTPIANREQAEISGLIGFFVNTIVLRDEIEVGASFSTLLSQVKETCLSGYMHQDVPFEQIVDDLNLERDQSRTPLFQTLFVLQNNEDVDVVYINESPLEPLGIKHTLAKFDLTLTLSENNEGINAEIQYATALFKEETIVRLSQHFEVLTRSIVANVNLSIGLFEMSPKEEKCILLDTFSSSSVLYDKSQTIISLFEEQVEKTPNATALVFENTKLSYKELDDKSNQLANYLFEKGISKNMLVPVCIEPSLETMIALFGIMKAGAGYVPIDPIFPADRIEFILKDIEANFLLSTKITELSSEIKENISILYVDEFTYENYSSSPLKLSISLEDIIYVIYTSGTTGNPKGVMIQHGSLLDYVHGICGSTSIMECKSFALITSIAADVVNTALYPPFILGGELHILPKEMIMDAEAMSKLSVDCVKVVPSHWYSLQSEKFTFLPKKCLIFGGEELKEEMLFFLKEKKYLGDVYNHYGPTETTVGKLINKIDLQKIQEKITLGKPFGNTQVLILDDKNQLCPIGIPGEICIAGEGLAKGYINQEVLTAAKFKTIKLNEAIIKVYKTGDVGKWLSTGEVDFLGRKDDQIKIRGYRVELKEIAVILESFDEIKQSVITVVEDESGGEQLVSYVVLEEAISDVEIQRKAKEKLPDYMVPKTYIILEAFPLTSNGKVDKKQLPKPTIKSQTKVYVAPKTAIEAKLVDIWETLLKVKKIGVHDNFFELGGDSIKAIQLVSRSRVAGINHMVKDIFTYQTISEIALYVKNNSVKIIAEKGGLEGNVPLHPIQRDFFERGYAVQNHYNQSVLLTVSKSVEENVLKEAVKRLTHHHDALRLQFETVENTIFPIQTYSSRHAELATETVASIEEISSICNKYQASLNISKGDITRFVWIQTPEKEVTNRLLIVVHHLAIDGISWRILIEDFMMLIEKLYHKEPVSLPGKGSSYRQWVEKLAEYVTSETLLSEYEYWKETVSKFIELRIDTTETLNAKPESYVIALSKEQTQLLVHETNRVYETEINDILLSALSMSLKNWCADSNLMIHLEGHGREELFDDIDIYRTIGWFTTLYPVNLEIPKNGNDIKKHVINTKNILRQIPNKGIGYAVLHHLATSEEVRNSLKVPKKDIIFNYLGSFDNTTSTSEKTKEENLIGFAGEDKGFESAIENQHSYRLAINGMIVDGQMQFEWNFNEKDFNEETIMELANAFNVTLEKIIKHCTLISEKTKKEDEHMLLFQSEGAGVPLFLIPPLGGTSAFLEEFASNLGTDRPIYGLEMEGLFDGEKALHTIHEIAVKNIERIKAMQPEGPYVFMGYSFGGSVAFEMAKQLEQTNDEVLPILLDQPAFFDDNERGSAEEIAKRTVEMISETITGVVQSHKLFDKWQDDLAQRLDIENVDESWNTVIDFLQENNIEFTNGIEVFGRVFKLFLTNVSLSYITEGNIQNMLLVRSERDDTEYTACLGWEHFVENIHLVNAKGNHLTIIREENGKALGSKIQTILNTLVTKEN